MGSGAQTADPVKDASRVGRERLTVALVAILAAYAGLLIASLISGAWLIEPGGAIIPYDYVNLYSAGRLAIEGHAADAYSYAAHKAAQDRALGYAFDIVVRGRHQTPFESPR